jgi:YVTN family beta-propeller protein
MGVLSSVTLCGLVLASVATPRLQLPVEAERPEPAPLVTGRRITPEGKQTNVGSFPANMLLSPDGRYLVVTNTGYRQFLSVLSGEDGHLVSRLAFNALRKDGSRKKEGLYFGLAFGAGGKGETLLYVSRGAEDRIGVYRLTPEGTLAEVGPALDDPSGVGGFRFPHHVAGLALNRDGSRLYAVNNNTGPESGNHGSLSILDTTANRVVGKVPVGGYPYSVAAVTAGPAADRKVYVTSERDGVVSVVDPAAGRVSGQVATGDHPVALLLSRDQARLFVANAGSDTVSVVDTGADRVTQTFPLRPDDARGLPGCTPTGLALSPDEHRLYVTLADMNAVAVVDLIAGRVVGYIPVGWYPTAVVCSPDGKQLFVANAKGVRERVPNADSRGHVHNLLEGTVATIPVPDGEALEQFTRQVLANNLPAPGAVPDAVGAFRNPGIEHVFYIIKENRTYDQVLGDLPQGNGDPRLCFFPREVTPNQHALAERFALLDNFYCCAEVSADGWNWSTSGMANEYVVRNAPYGYSERGRDYDYEGQNGGVPVDLRGIADVARSPGGYFWDLVIGKGLSLRNYGCFVNVGLTDTGVPVEGGRAPAANRAAKQVLGPRTDEDYRQFDLAYADSDAWVAYHHPAPKQRKAFGKAASSSRYAEWKREFDAFLRDGNLPRCTMLRLPRDHTQGTTARASSPRAMVADNDYAVGQIVQTVSESPYWKKAAIFILEDDAQNGFDHVDAHRSIALVISPFIQHGTVDHRFYNTDSFLRTMELILGLPPLCQYDAIAPPLQVFGAQPGNDTPYRAILPGAKVIAEVNRATAYRAGDSARLNFCQEDAVPDQVLNDILWHALEGLRTPKPAIRYGLRLRPDREGEERADRAARDPD